MDKIQKLLKRLTETERDCVTKAMVDIVAGELVGYDHKKMRGYANLYRVRVRDIRIVFLEQNGERRIVLVARRDDTTYHDF